MARHIHRLNPGPHGGVLGKWNGGLFGVYCFPGNWIPSPNFAAPGMVTGNRPVSFISPNSAFTADTSEVTDGL